MLDGSDLNATSSKPSTPPSDAEAATDEQEQESEHIDYDPVPTTVSMTESHSSTDQAIEYPNEGGGHSTSRASLLADYQTHVKVPSNFPSDIFTDKTYTTETGGTITTEKRGQKASRSCAKEGHCS